MKAGRPFQFCAFAPDPSNVIAHINHRDSGHHRTHLNIRQIGAHRSNLFSYYGRFVILMLFQVLPPNKMVDLNLLG
jgi:hypothetical protein